LRGNSRSFISCCNFCKEHRRPKNV